MSFLDGLRRLNREGLKSVFFPDYVVNPWPFRAALILAALLLVAAFLVDGLGVSEQIYYSCPASGGPCANPYNPGNVEPWRRAEVVESCPDPDFCKVPVFQPGESWGHKPSWMTTAYFPVVFILFIIAGIINHVLFNQAEGKE